MSEDPFAVLGVPVDATVEQLRAARRRLAMQLHPDVGGDEQRMRDVNRAYEEATALRSQPPARRPAATGSPAPSRSRHQVEYDSPSFVIEALPVVAHEALLVVASWIGEVLVDDPPYLLEVQLDAPLACWCRLDLVPDAGSTTVSLTIAIADRLDHRAASLPDVEAVRDEWVAQLNQLVRWDPSG